MGLLSSFWRFYEDSVLSTPPWPDCRGCLHSLVGFHLQSQQGPVKSFPWDLFLPYSRALWLPWGFPSGSVVKNLPVMQEMWVLSPGWKDPLKEEMATYSSISCQDNHIDRGALRATGHGITKSQTWLNNWTELTDSLQCRNSTSKDLPFRNSQSQGMDMFVCTHKHIWIFITALFIITKIL